MRHTLYFCGMTWRQFNCAFGLCSNLGWPANGNSALCRPYTSILQFTEPVLQSLGVFFFYRNGPPSRSVFRPICADVGCAFVMIRHWCSQILMFSVFSVKRLNYSELIADVIIHAGSLWLVTFLIKLVYYKGRHYILLRRGVLYFYPYGWHNSGYLFAHAMACSG